MDILFHCAIVVFSLIISSTSAGEWRTHEYVVREHSLVKPYQGMGTTIPYWDFLGSTMVTNNYIRLTGDIQSQRGAVWNTSCCLRRYVKDPMQEGDVFGSKDYFSGLAVIMDTYSNHNGPHNYCNNTSELQDILEERANIMPSASFFEAPRDHVEDPKPSSLSTGKQVVLLIVGVVLICACVFIGGLIYSKQQEQQRKRFY
ncbi:Vesicular integral-membrane protein VIP36 [Portunus trituberculatus]|uniref:Vesicular integral-membrane protein VIP36 n=1 Tax=Portunus trituberculatus TaxID=210409 RepID=A0A5B7DY06_PORTR|nr:Vesicular integral-membrane protein VIP36 [Portunus trituberculatus]